MEKSVLDIDYKKFLIPEGEIGFSPARNKAIIEDSIKRYDLMKARRQKDYMEQVRERANAVTTYLFDTKAQQTGTPVEKYFGKRTLAALRANKIVSTLQFKNGIRSTNLQEAI